LVITGSRFAVLGYLRLWVFTCSGDTILNHIVSTSLYRFIFIRSPSETMNQWFRSDINPALQTLNPERLSNNFALCLRGFVGIFPVCLGYEFVIAFLDDLSILCSQFTGKLAVHCF
jgi:hypothetical protein